MGTHYKRCSLANEGGSMLSASLSMDSNIPTVMTACLGTAGEEGGALLCLGRMCRGHHGSPEAGRGGQGVLPGRGDS